MTSRAGLSASDVVLEIGAGGGILTEGILSAGCGALHAIELDVRLKPGLEIIAQRDSRLNLHWGDAVSFDYLTLDPAPSCVIANLPYHITTPLIWRLLETLPGRGLRGMLLMTQYEAACRIASGAPGRESNPLGITIAAMGEAVLARRVSRGAFRPTPRVDSAIVEIKLSGARIGLPNDGQWRRLLSGSFAQRRKTLVNNWVSSFGVTREEAASWLAVCGLLPLSRPEELGLESWLALREEL